MQYDITIWGCKSCTDSFDFGGYFWGSFIVWWCYIKTSHREDISIISYLSGYMSRTFYRRIPFSKSGYFSLVQYQQCLSFLTHFSPVSHFNTPRRRQKKFGFMTFSGGYKCDTGLKSVNEGKGYQVIQTIKNLSLKYKKRRQTCYDYLSVWHWSTTLTPDIDLYRWTGSSMWCSSYKKYFPWWLLTMKLINDYNHIMMTILNVLFSN